MAKWLDKYEQGGLVLKKKTKDNYDLKANPNDVKVSAGPGFVGEGYTAQNWKSPAWGGQFQMGGSLPGSVGFMYARTQNPAPANGKYTKKTLASAQNGQEMRYYQDGLDFKPKSISKNGKWLDKGQLGITTGVNSGTVNPTVKNITQDEIREIELNKKLDKQGSIKKAEPKKSVLADSWSILTNPMTALGYVVKGRGLPEHFDRGPRNVLDYATDIVNPYQVVNAAASIPGNIARGELGEAALNTLGVLPVLHELGAATKLTNTIGQLSKAKNLKEAAAYTLKGIPVEKSLPRLAEGELKTFRQLQEIPKMNEAGKSRVEQMKYAIENNIPDTHFERIFDMPKEKAQDLINRGFGERPAVDREALRNRFREIDAQSTIPENPSASARERWIAEISGITTENPNVSTRVEPAHDFYESLGHRTTPTSYDQMTDSEIESLRNHLFDRYMSRRRERIANENSMLNFDDDIDREFIDMTPLDRDGTPITNPYALDFMPEEGTTVPQDLINSLRNSARNNFIRSGRNVGDKITKSEIKARGKLENFIENATQNYPYYSGNIEEKVPTLFRANEKSLTDISRKVAKQTENIPSGTVYTGSLNTSHNSWLPQVKQIFNYSGGTPQFTGYKPMNSLGYLSKVQVPEEDVVKYLNSEMDELVKRGKLPNDIQRPFMHKGHPILPQYAIKQHREGGIIDPMGQWAHPGEVTTIPSNNITMKGVDYDVLGVSDTGDTKMMKPGKDYKFKGKSVTEYPKGGWLNKYK